MSDSVIIIVADDNYEAHAQALMVNCVEQGGWKDDFCVIAPAGARLAGMRNRGIPIHEVSDIGFMAKFCIFDDYFHRWKWAFYVDCDVLVQGDLYRLFEMLKYRPPGRWGHRAIWCNHEDNSILASWKHWDGTKVEEHAEMYAEMEKEFPHINERMVCTSYLLFEPASIPPGIPDKLRALQERFADANRVEDGGTDQQIINLLPELYKQMHEVPDKLFCYWGLDNVDSRVASDYRGYKGGEMPVVLHYCRFYAPWLEKEPNADAYLHLRSGLRCLDIYRTNLALFNERFPLKPAGT